MGEFPTLAVLWILGPDQRARPNDEPGAYAHTVPADSELTLPVDLWRDGTDSERSDGEQKDPGLPAWLAWFDRGGPAWKVLGVLGAVMLVAGVGFVVGVRVTGPPTDDVDVGFLQDMTEHHNQAVTMALLELTNGSDKEVLGFAREVLAFQRWELGKMDAYLEARDIEPVEYDLNRPVMRWMDMGGTLADMPGMASAGQLDQLKNATGLAADRLFLTLMTEHHRGGLHMAEYAEAHASDPLIRNLAGTMARNQRGEITEYARTIARLGT